MNIAGWLNDIVYVAAATGSTDAFGDPSFSAQRAVKARVESVSELVRGADGNEIQCGHKIITTTEIGLGDRIWLEGADLTDNDAAKRPQAVNSSSNKPGTWTLYEVLL